MGRVCEHRISRRGVARRAARRGGVRACQSRTLRADSRPVCLPQRLVREIARQGRRGNRSQSAETLRDGREEGARRVRRKTGLYGIPGRALAPNQDEQRDRAHQPRNQEEDEGRRDLPGRQLGPHAGDGETEVHSGARVGQEEVPGHVEAGGDGRAEGKGGGLEEDGAGDG